MTQLEQYYKTTDTTDLNYSNDIPPFYVDEIVMARWHSCKDFQPARVRYCGKTHGIGFVAVHFLKGFPASVPYENAMRPP
mgnify:CR=1 FL=1